MRPCTAARRPQVGWEKVGRGRTRWDKVGGWGLSLLFSLALPITITTTAAIAASAPTAAAAATAATVVPFGVSLLLLARPS